MYDDIVSIIKALEESGADELKNSCVVRKDEKEYIFTYIIKRKEDKNNG